MEQGVEREAWVLPDWAWAAMVAMKWMLVCMIWLVVGLYTYAWLTGAWLA